MSEGVEQIDELSNKTLGNYIRKGHSQGRDVSKAVDKTISKSSRKIDDNEKKAIKALWGRKKVDEEQIDEVNAKKIQKDLDSGLSYDVVIGKHANKRTSNTDAIRKVIQQHAWNKRMKKEENESEQIDELSKKTLGNYLKKASHDVATKSAATARYAERSNVAKDRHKQGDYSGWQKGREDDETSNKFFAKSWKRRQGMAKAIDKLTDNSVRIEADETMKKKAKTDKDQVDVSDEDMVDVTPTDKKSTKKVNLANESVASRIVSKYKKNMTKMNNKKETK
jgi:hypothetical protein